ncbi:MAG: class I SAM-dependent methyltransferase [Candidatus Cloacimonetes bacterium]|nr:class I SAM-dependent methyltransferase [Candidatus Cloacimonadota bacterium]
MKFGDFSGLAQNYSLYRPGYAPTIQGPVEGYLNKSFRGLSVADVGAGTGIFSRMLAQWGAKVTAVEPNHDMRNVGIEDSREFSVRYQEGNAENTGLDSNSVDFLSMASSFHWADFDKATQEFFRVLKPGGVFSALWNPRWIERNPKLVEIEAKVHELCPGLRRVSSGNSAFTQTLLEKLQDCGKFSDVMYLEATHVMPQSKKHYIGVWESVNDIRVQMGETVWPQFIEYLNQKIEDSEILVTTYKTRMWLARVTK